MSNTPPPAAFGLPYSAIRQVGDFYYVAGHTGADAATKTAASDIKGQTTKLFENLKATLDTYGLTFDDIVKTTVFLADMEDFSAMNEVYVTHFADPKPARSTVAVKELPRVADVPLKIEIEAVAYKKF